MRCGNALLLSEGASYPARPRRGRIGNYLRPIIRRRLTLKFGIDRVRLAARQMAATASRASAGSDLVPVLFMIAAR